MGSYNKYLLCVITLSMGVMMCVFVGNKFIVGKIDSEAKIESSNWNAEIIISNGNINSDFISNIKQIKGVKNIYNNMEYNTRIKTEANMLDSYYSEAYEKEKESMPFKGNSTIDVEEDGKYINIVSAIVGGDKNLINLSKDYIIDGEINENSLNNNKIILVNSTRLYHTENSFVGNKSYKNIKSTTKYKVGDKIKVPIKNTEKSKEYEIAAIIDKNPLKDTVEFNSGYEYSPIPDISIIMSVDNYKNQSENNNLESIYLKIDESDRLNIINNIKEQSKVENIEIIDRIEEREKVQKKNNEYLFWDLILLGTLWIVFLLNILNTMVSIIMSRLSQVATLRAIGMTKEQLKKSIVYEGMLLSKDILCIGLFFSIFTLVTQIKYIKDGRGVFLQFILIILLVVISQLLMSLVSSFVAIRMVMKNVIVEEMK